MKPLFFTHLDNLTKKATYILVFLATNIGIAQQQTDFWKKVRFGGGLGLGLNSGHFSAIISPSAIYDFDKTFSAGLGLQGTYTSKKNEYHSHIYGVTGIFLFNPIRKIQLSAELERLNVNIDYENNSSIKRKNENFWTTALFLGAGFRTKNVIVGLKYNVLHYEEKKLYDNAIIPFIRIYF